VEPTPKSALNQCPKGAVEPLNLRRRMLLNGKVLMKLVVLAASVVTVTACGVPATKPADTGRVNAEYDKSSGRLTRVEEDTDGDGKVDKWETYRGGTLASMALDTSGRGTPDRKLLYKADGSFDRMEKF